MRESRESPLELENVPGGFPHALVAQLDQLGNWGVLATDLELKITNWNDWLFKRSGVPVADAIGRSLFELFPDLRTRGFDRQYRQAIAGQPVILSQLLHSYLLPMRPEIANSNLEFMQQSVRILPLVDGAVQRGTLTLIEDVTERVMHEAELQSRAQRQSAVASASQTALVSSEVEHVARAIAKLVRETLRWELVEVLEYVREPESWARLAGEGWGKPSLAVFNADTATRTHPMWDAEVLMSTDALRDPHFGNDPQLRLHQVQSALVVRVRGRDDRPFGLIGVYAKSRRFSSPEEVEFVRSLSDVLGMTVERNRLEDELRIHVLELAEAAQRKDEFLAMLAHELRNPLAPVRNGLMILQMTEDKPDIARDTREMIDRQVRHLSRLVDDLLDVSRITRGKVELRVESIDLTEVVNQAIETVRPLIESRKHRLNVSHHGGPVRVMGDATRLTQVLGNLLNNAAKYTEVGGDISLVLGLEYDRAVVQISDTGIGISARMLPKVFDLFTQVDSTLDRSQGGLGIGLTLVKTLVELHGGQVRASSEGPGKGSTFVVELPAHVGAARDSLPTQPTDIHIRPHRILVVDDNVDSAESLAMVLRYSGHDVRTAHTGIRGLEAAHEFAPEVVFLDIGLPAMDGYEVARRLREQRECADTLIIAMTGYGSDDDRRKSSEAGFDHHLVKPLDPAEVTRFLEGRPAG